MAIPVANAGTDQTIAFGALPTTASLTGGGTDPDSGTIVSYAWSILWKPAGSAAALSSASAQNPTLNGVDAAGTYLLFLVVTDSSAEVSESNPLLAPDGAFVAVYVTSANLALKYGAAGGRNYMTARNAWLTALDTLKGDFDAHDIADHDTSATGAELDTLTDGSSATGLHTHAGADVAVATASAVGSVKMADAPKDAGVPTATTRDRMPLVAQIGGTMAADRLVAAYVVDSDVYVVGLAVALEDGGLEEGVHTFQVYEMTTAEIAAEDYAGAGAILAANLTLTQGLVAGDPLGGYLAAAADHAVTAGNWLVVRVVAVPGSDEGENATCTIVCQRYK
jgi:hypothetical protein